MIGRWIKIGWAAKAGRLDLGHHVNPRGVATLPDQLDLFVVHTHMLCVHLPTGNWPPATCFRVVEADPLRHTFTLAHSPA